MRIARGSEGGGKREPLASGKPHPILPAGAASNDAQNVRDECARDVTARRDGHTTRKAARTMNARDSLDAFTYRGSEGGACNDG